jgi:tetratricopeptide (TPR) repeat protein
LADELIEYLWPGCENLRSAASNLRGRVAELRKIFGPSFIITRRGGYGVAAEGDCWSDAEEFSHLEELGRRAYGEGRWEEALVALREAVALYRGEYLAEDRYEEWAFQIRERYRERFVEVLSLLADSLARQGQYARALGYLERAIGEAPLQETLYRQMMVYAFCAGERARALGAYERCRAVLERELGERPSSQTEQLYRQIQSERVAELERVYPRAAPPPRLPGRMRQPPFVGRTREWAQLASALGKARSGMGQLVLISGEAGVGKTRLGEEFLRWAHTQGVQTLYGRCYELENPLPWQPWREALSGGISQVSRADLVGIPPAWLAELAEIIPELRSLCEFSGMVLPQEFRQYRLFEALSAVIGALAARAPLIVMLDDLQWADSQSLDFLCYLLERGMGESLFIIGAARTEELGGKLDRVRHQGARFGRLEEIPLGRLSEQELQELVEKLADELEVASDFGGHLYRESMGNPLLATAVLQALFENGAFTPQGGRWCLREPVRVELMPHAQVLLRRRVQRTSAAAQRVLQLLACAGQLELAVIEAAWEGTSEELLAHLAELVSQGLVSERGGRYECVHDKFREVVYEQLEEPRRIWLHRRIAQAIEHVYSDPVAAGLAAQVAQHYERGGQPLRALEWVMRGVEECQRRYQIEEGLQLVEQGLKILQTVKERLSVHERVEKEFKLIEKKIELGLKVGQVSELEHSLRLLFEMASTAQNPNLEAKAYMLTALYKAHQGEHLEELKAARKAYSLYKKANYSKGLGESLHEIGIAYFYLGRYRRALRCFELAYMIFQKVDDKHLQAALLDTIGCTRIALGDLSGIDSQLQGLELIRKIGDLGEENKLLNNIAIIYGLMGDYQRAGDFFEQSRAIAQQIGDRFGMGMALLNLGEIFRLSGVPQKALDYLDQAQKIFTELHSPVSQAKALWRKGCAYRDAGEYEQACACFQEALESYQKLEDPVNKALCCVEYAETCIALGRLEEASRNLHQALELIQELDMVELAAECWSALGEVHLREERFYEALQASQKSLELLREQKLHVRISILALWRHFLILKSLNRLDEARGFLHQAYTKLQQLADKFTDDHLRASFLNIPLHRQILTELARA